MAQNKWVILPTKKRFATFFCEIRISNKTTEMNACIDIATATSPKPQSTPSTSSYSHSSTQKILPNAIRGSLVAVFRLLIPTTTTTKTTHLKKLLEQWQRWEKEKESEKFCKMLLLTERRISIQQSNGETEKWSEKGRKIVIVVAIGAAEVLLCKKRKTV